MAILGIGVDILHLPRFASLLARRGLYRTARRILSPVEISEWSAIPEAASSRKSAYLSTRWAVKEAAFKAMFSSTPTIWKDWSYQSSGIASKLPRLDYTPVGERQAIKDLKLHVTVSHDGQYVMAYVVVETLPSTKDSA